jgi:hypothetical protein
VKSLIVGLWLSVALVLGVSAPSYALPITWQLTGEVTSASTDELRDIFTPGVATVEYLVTFDPDYPWLVVPGLGYDLQNQQAGFDYTAAVAGLPFGWNGLASSYGQWNGLTRELAVDGSIGSGGVDGTVFAPSGSWGVFAIDFRALLADGGSGAFTMYLSETPVPNGPFASVTGTFTNVKEVPEPSTLLFLSLGALLFARKRK